MSAVASVLLELVAAWNRGDADGFGGAFARSATYVTGGGREVRGRAAIADLVGGDEASVKVAGRMQVQCRGSTGVARFAWSSTGPRGPARRGIIACALAREGNAWLIQRLTNQERLGSRGSRRGRRVIARGRAFRDPRAFRDWLRKHHGSAVELVVRCHKTAHAERGITYRQALDEALCFGWIDGVRRGVDERTFAVRFTPRKARSGWSQVNLERAAQLQAEGRMQPAGLAALRRRAAPAYSHESVPHVLSGAFLRRLRASRAAWRFFQSQPPGYRRTAAAWVLSARRPATQEARFTVLLASSEAGTRIPLLRREAPRRGLS